MLDLDALRRCMLHANMAIDLDSLVGLSSVQRVMLIVKSLHQHGLANPAIKRIVDETNLMDSLRTEAHRRANSPASMATVLIQRDSHSSDSQRSSRYV